MLPYVHSWFQLTAARRRLETVIVNKINNVYVSTHSRPKAAGRVTAAKAEEEKFQLTAARRRLEIQMISPMINPKFQLTAARRRLVSPNLCPAASEKFQLTAARRRLENLIGVRTSPSRFNSQPPEGGWLTPVLGRMADNLVSTHSRPKAAGPPTV